MRTLAWVTIFAFALNTLGVAQTAYPNQGAGQAQQPELGQRPQPMPPQPGQHQIAAGAEIHATLDTALSTKTSRVGDQFTATVQQPVTATDGTVVLPAGTKIRGEVAGQESGKTLPDLRGKGRLDLRFSEAVLPDGRAVPIRATLMQVTNGSGKKTANTNSEGEVTGTTSGTRTAKDVGIGAGAGTLAGLIFGSALKGLAIGAIAGGGYVLATHGKDVNIPAESGLVLRLDQSITV